MTIQLFQTRTSLVPADVESVLRRTRDRLFTNTGEWNPDVLKAGLFVDCSRLEWVELSAVLRTVLLTESARRHGAEVTVALPLTTHSVNEERFSRETPVLLRRAPRRRAVLDFLHRLDFVGALRAEHLPPEAGELTLLEGYDRSLNARASEPELAEATVEVEGPPLREREPYTLRLTWLDGSASDKTAEVADQLTSIIARATTSASDFDAGALSHVVLYELLQNVVQHAGVSHGLVGAFVAPGSRSIREGEHLVDERAFVRWLAEAGRPSITISVGDSGVGIAERLGPAFDRHASSEERARDDRASEIIQWAFERQSTSGNFDRLGTRGLYRIDRIVKRHTGLITVRADRYLRGWDHGGAGYDERVHNAEALAPSPGTVLRVTLVSHPRDLPRRPPPQPPGDLRFTVEDVSVGEGVTHMTGSPEAASHTAGAQDDCHILVPETRLDRKELGDLLRHLSELRDPEAVVVAGIDDTSIDVRELINELNLDVARARRHLEQATTSKDRAADPVLVISRDVARWSGASPDVAMVLDHLLDAPDASCSSKDLRALLETDVAADEVRRALLRDSALARVTDNEGIHLRLHRRAVMDALAQHFGRRVEDLLRETRGVRITPSLARVDGWIRVPKLIRGVADARLVALVLDHRFRELGGRAAPTLLIADTSVEPDRARAISVGLGTRRHDLLPFEVGSEDSVSPRIADRSDRVVIYADLISSGASAQRLMAQVVRDGARLLAVICCVDARATPGEPLEFWGGSIPVVSVVQRSTAVDPDDPRPADFVDETGDPEPDLSTHADYVMKKRELLDVAAREQAIRMGHIGGTTGRHFTFYLDANRIIELPEFHDAIRKITASWLEQLGTVDGPGEVWYPSPEQRAPSPAQTLANLVAAELDGFRLRAVERHPVWGGSRFKPPEPGVVEGGQVVIVDRGSIEGDTMFQLIRLAGEAGAERILVCSAMSQLDAESEWRLAGLRTMEVMRRESTTLMDEQRHRREVDVDVRFVTALPIAAYSAAECPVCQQLRDLGSLEWPTPTLADFAKRQREERLQLIDQGDVVRDGLEDLDEEPLDGEQAAAMLGLRDELTHAVRSTRGRYEVVEKLQRITEDTSLERARMLVRLLSLETQWLQQPPLVLGRARGLVATIARRLAESTAATSGDRCCAIDVLRAASKTEFADAVATVYSVVEGDDHAVEHLLSGLTTLLARPYLQSPDVWRTLDSRFESIMADLDAGRVGRSSYDRDLGILHDRVKGRLNIAELGQQPLAHTWADLKRLFEHMQSAHHGVLSAFRRLESFPQQVARAPSPELMVSARGDWAIVSPFLRDELLPLLRRISPILQGIQAQSRFGAHWNSVVERVTTDQAPGEWRISQLLEAGGGDPRDPQAEAMLKEIVDEITWIADNFLRSTSAGVPGGQAAFPAALVTFLRDVPASLVGPVQAAAEADPPENVATVRCELPSDCPPVMFPQNAVQELVQELVANAGVHHVSGEPGAEVSLVVTPEPPFVRLLATSINTAPSGRPGTFLSGLTKELRRFGGDLESEFDRAGRRHLVEVTFAMMESG
jgi:orotate phosphoribosyltransferase